MYAREGGQWHGRVAEARKVFVSYCHADSPVVDGCVRLLMTGGAAVFYDQLTIPAGMTWSAVIGGGLAEADIVLVFVSDDAVRSSAVRDEYLKAIELGKLIAPVLLDRATMPAELSGYQAIDLRGLLPKGRRRPRASRPPSRELARLRPLPAVHSLDEETRRLLPAAVAVKATLARRLSLDPRIRTDVDPLQDPTWMEDLKDFKREVEDLADGEEPSRWRRTSYALLLVAALGVVAVLVVKLVVERRSSRRPAEGEASLLVRREATPREYAVGLFAHGEGKCLLKNQRVIICSNSCEKFDGLRDFVCGPRPEKVFCGEESTRGGDPAGCYLSEAACRQRCTSCEEYAPSPLPTGKVSSAELAQLKANVWCLDDGASLLMRCDYPTREDCEAMRRGSCVRRPPSIYCGYDRGPDDALNVQCHATEKGCRSRVASPESCTRVDF